ncbi:Hypothetical protein, putative [Bodo saltans]|uniref:Uncharacterized protein n=1 Tax=Bodo saltans TaxID=75058 RepID=A0A0S4IS80_BODSA|nr:Hypothetical protein, putative [Bodo saltans]|eukprot:CUF62674.1 Hypothetical protein, putative [Bodo saltans]
MSISALRATSRVWRDAVETVPSHISFGSGGEIFLSKNGACAIYNPRRESASATLAAVEVGSPIVPPSMFSASGNMPPSAMIHALDDNNNNGAAGASSSLALELPGSFALHCVNPVGRKFRDETAKVLRQNALLSNQRHSGLAVLHLHHAVISEQCFVILGDLPSLVDLQLVMCRGVTSLREVSHMASLQVLDVLMCDVNADGVDGLFLPHLKRLKIKRCPRLEAINGIAPETLASLIELRIEDCPLLADDSCSDAAGHLRQIERLSLAFTSTGEFPMFLSPEARATLRELDMSQTNCSTEVLQHITEDTKALEILRLEDCEAILSIQPLESLTALVALDISGNDNPQLDALSSLGGTLRSLRIADAPFLQFLSFLRLMSVLEILDLSRSGIGDAEIIPIGSLKKLQVLFLSGCSSVTNLNPLGACKELRKLFAGATSLTHDGSVMLVGCKNLEELDVSNTEIESINHFSSLPHLRILNAFGSLESVRDAAEVVETGRVQVLMDCTLPLRDGSQF